eukprot:4948890-Prymnesium_polylepis.1
MGSVAMELAAHQDETTRYAAAQSAARGLGRSVVPAIFAAPRSGRAAEIIAARLMRPAFSEVICFVVLRSWPAAMSVATQAIPACGVTSACHPATTNALTTTRPSAHQTRFALMASIACHKAATYVTATTTRPGAQQARHA